MIRKLAIACMIGLLLSCSTSDKEQRQRIPDGTYRPSGFHAFITHGSGNDPISLLKADTAYHLFYTTSSDEWGHLISSDMLSWQAAASFPIQSHGYGEVIRDENNLTGYNAPWNILWSDGNQLFLSYSQDGSEWNELENPVLIAQGLPAVNWNEDLELWILTVTNNNEVSMYTSQNLSEWKASSSIPVENAQKASLLRIDGEWVLITYGITLGYQLGTFDTAGFVPDKDQVTFQAINGLAVVMNGEDETIIISKNETIDSQVPTFSTPLSIQLNESKLNVMPSKTLQSQIVGKRRARLNKLLTDGPSWYNFTVDKDFESIEILIRDNSSEVRMAWNKSSNAVEITGSALATAAKEEPLSFEYAMSQENVSVDILIDHASVDLFLNNGEFATSILVLPDTFFSSVELYLDGEKYDARGILYDIGI